MTTASKPPLERSRRGAGGRPLLACGSGPLTVDGWYALPQTLDRYELYQGMLIMAPPPDGSHQTIVSELLVALVTFGRARGGRAWAAPIGVQLDDRTALEPDVVYVSAERMDTYTTRGIRGAPDIVVEVASPSTRAFDLGTKLPTYLANGVREVWIADPVARTVAVYEAGREEPRVCAFGEPIPSSVAEVGNANLDRLPQPAD